MENASMTLTAFRIVRAGTSLTALSVVRAQPAAAPPHDVLTLSAQATVEVPYDVMAMTLSTTRDGTDAAAVQTLVRQAVDAALVEARKAQRPGQLDVRTGAFSLSPRYGNKGAISAWVGQAELVLEGRDMNAIAQLAGRLNTLTVLRVGYALARDTRERVEADAVAQAIARFRARAADYAKQFGYAGYAVREVNVGTSEPGIVQPLVRSRMVASSAGDESIPVEAGMANVTVSVNGSVQMTR
jgi:predicted secreted protein